MEMGKMFLKSNTWWSTMHFYGLPLSPNIALSFCFVFVVIVLFLKDPAVY